MKHYGIWVRGVGEEGWLQLYCGGIFWTTGMGVAKEMLNILHKQFPTSEQTVEIKEFEE